MFVSLDRIKATCCCPGFASFTFSKLCSGILLCDTSASHRDGATELIKHFFLVDFDHTSPLGEGRL